MLWRNRIMQITEKANVVAEMMLATSHTKTAHELAKLSALTLEAWQNGDYIQSIAEASILEYRLGHFGGSHKLAIVRVRS